MEQVIITTAVAIHPSRVRRGTGNAESIGTGPFVLEFLAPNGAAYRVEGCATGEPAEGAPVSREERVQALAAAFQARPETIPAVLEALALSRVPIPDDTLRTVAGVETFEPPEGCYYDVDGTLRDLQSGEEVVKSRPLAPGEL